MVIVPLGGALAVVCSGAVRALGAVLGVEHAVYLADQLGPVDMCSIGFIIGWLYAYGGLWVCNIWHSFTWTCGYLGHRYRTCS